MTMNVNATLVIQAINFSIAYILLRKFLLKPAVAVMQHEQQEQESVKIVIAQQEQSLILKENERQKNWHNCRAYFKENRPCVDAPQLFVFKGLTPDIIPHTTEDKVFAKLLADTRIALVKKIGRVYE